MPSGFISIPGSHIGYKHPKHCKHMWPVLLICSAGRKVSKFMYVHQKDTSRKKKTTTSTALAVSWLHLDGASHLEEEKQYRQDKGLVQVQVTAVTIISQQPQTFEPMSITKKKLSTIGSNAKIHMSVCRAYTNYKSCDLYYHAFTYSQNVSTFEVLYSNSRHSSCFLHLK